MKKKGFTLIELLAVIVILAVIAIVITPMIMSTIKASQMNSWKDSTYGMVSTIENYYARKLTTANYAEVTGFDLATDTELEYSGERPKTGKAVLYADGSVAIEMSNGVYCAYKTRNNDTIIVTDDLNKCSGKNVNPQITIDNLADDATEINQEVNTSFVIPGATSVNDGESLTVNLVVTDASGAVQNLTYGQALSTETVGTVYNLKYNVSLGTNYSNERDIKVTIVDTKPPVVQVDSITGQKDVITYIGDNYVLPSAVVTDNSCGTDGKTTTSNNCSATLVASVSNGGYSSTVVGKYVVTYTATDSSNNQSVFTLNVDLRNREYSSWADTCPDGKVCQSQVEYGYQDVSTWSSSYSTTVPSDGFYTSKTQYRYITKALVLVKKANDGDSFVGCGVNTGLCDQWCNTHGSGYTIGVATDGSCKAEGGRTVCPTCRVYESQCSSTYSAWSDSYTSNGCSTQSQTVYAAPSTWQTATGWTTTGPYTKTTTRKALTKTVYRYQTN
jgi:prepilin-type N-terminal cleavage/methylation domain-containing protein